MNLATSSSFFFLFVCDVHVCKFTHVHATACGKDNLGYWSSFSTFLDTGSPVSCCRCRASRPMSLQAFCLHFCSCGVSTEITGGLCPFLPRFCGSKFRPSNFPSMCFAHRFDNLDILNIRMKNSLECCGMLCSGHIKSQKL